MRYFISSEKDIKPLYMMIEISNKCSQKKKKKNGTRTKTAGMRLPGAGAA